MNIVLGVIVLFALLSLAVVVMQAIAMVRVAPASAKLGGFLPLGWWKFRQIKAKAGPAAAEPLNIYKRAVIAFLAFVALGLIVSGWALMLTPAPSNATAAAPSINDLRVMPAQFAPNTDIRRVATMPGALLLES